MAQFNARVFAPSREAAIDLHVYKSKTRKGEADRKATNAFAANLPRSK